MTLDLLLQLEQKVAQAIEVIELLRLQVEELEEENHFLKTEQEKWRTDLASIIKRFDQIETTPDQKPRFAVKQDATEEDLVSV